MLRTILIALDGSSLAERAVPYAARLARAASARLLLVHVTSWPDPASFSRWEGLALAKTRTLLDKREVAQALTDLAAHLRAEGLEAETIVSSGDAAEVILETAQSRQADLLALSTHGRGGLGRWLYGSVADQVLRGAEVPVMLVPAASTAAWPGNRSLRLLVPLDGSSFGEAALAPARDLAQLLGADLLLLRVLEPPLSQRDELQLRLELTEAQRYLRLVADGLRGAGLAVATRAMAGDPSSAIASVAQEQGADLIAMATHGRGGLTRLLMGSVATGTLQRARVPLLLVGPASLRRATGQARA